MSDTLEQDLREMYAEDARRYETTGAEERLSGIDFRQRKNHHRNVGMFAGVSVAIAAGIAAVVLLVVSGGSASLPPLKGSSYSLAGWTSVPTSSSSGLLRSATRSCDGTVARFAYVEALSQKQRQRERTTGFILPKSAIASVENVLTDVRDKYVAVVSLDDNASYVCIDGGRVQQGFTTSRDRGNLPYAQTGLLSPARVVHFGGVGYVNGTRVAGLEAGNHAYGRTGSGVTAVTFGFANGRTVGATVENGWYFAWWPWGSAPTSVQVKNSSGTFRSTTSCQPGSSGCVYKPSASATPTAPTTT
jgi:hypothetical protein